METNTSPNRLGRRQALFGIAATTAYTVASVSDSHAQGEPLSNLPNANGAVTPEMYGAKGDGVADDSEAFLAAIRSGRQVLCRSGATYLISRPLNPKAGESITIWGNSVRGKACSTIRAAKGFTGYLIEPSGSYDLRGLRIEGNGRDGCRLFGSNATGNSGFSILDSIDFRDAECFVYFGSEWEHPLGLSYDRIYGQGFRTAGIVLGGESGGARSGESAWHFGQIIVTNNDTRKGRLVLSQENVRVIQGDIVDHITWQSDPTLSLPFGWVVMRSSDVQSDWHVPPNWQVSFTQKTSFDAAKEPGEQWTYAVMRQTVGVVLRRAKAISINVIQAEYCGIGLFISNVFGFDIGSYYYESRGDMRRLNPSVAAAVFEHSYGSLRTAWIEECGHAIYAHRNAFVDLGVIRANRMRWSLLNQESGEPQFRSTKLFLTQSDTAITHRYRKRKM